MGGGELIDSRTASSKRVCNIAAIKLDKQLEKFCSKEESSQEKQQPSYAPQEQLAEDFFFQTVRRGEDGKYIVRAERQVCQARRLREYSG